MINAPTTQCSAPIDHNHSLTDTYDSHSGSKIVAPDIKKLCLCNTGDVESKPINARGVSISSTPPLIDQVLQLDTKVGLPTEMQKKVLRFAQSIEAIELPLYHDGYITLERKVRELIALCSEESLNSKSGKVEQVQQLFLGIRNLYPGLLLKIDHPGAFQLLR